MHLDEKTLERDMCLHRSLISFHEGNLHSIKTYFVQRNFGSVNRNCKMNCECLGLNSSLKTLK